MPEFAPREDLPHVVVQRYSDAARPRIILPDFVISAHAFPTDAQAAVDRENKRCIELGLYQSYRVVTWEQIETRTYNPYILEPL